MFQLLFSNFWEGDIDEGLGVNGFLIVIVIRVVEILLVGVEGLIIVNVSCFEFYCIEVLYKQSDGIIFEIFEVVILFVFCLNRGFLFLFRLYGCLCMYGKKYIFEQRVIDIKVVIYEKIIVKRYFS